MAAQEDDAHFLLTADFVLYLLSGNKTQFDVNPKAASCFADVAIVWFSVDLSSVTMGNLHFTHALVNKLHYLTLLADFPAKIDQNRNIQDINVNLLCGNCRQDLILHGLWFVLARSSRKLINIDILP